MPATTQWVVVTLDDVRTCALAEKLDLVFDRATAIGQSDPFVTTRTRVVARVRAKVAANPKNQLSADPTLVPPELIDATALLIAYGLLLPLTDAVAGLFSDSTKAAVEQAEKDLSDVAAGRYAVSLSPDAEAPGTGVAPSTGSISVVTANPRFATREGMRGL